jgi:hypothetical protein
MSSFLVVEKDSLTKGTAVFSQRQNVTIPPTEQKQTLEPTMGEEAVLRSDIFFVVLARDGQYVPRKIAELEKLGFRFVIICGKKINSPMVVHREARGKWDAINFARRFVHGGTSVVALNDVDTQIYNLDPALERFTVGADLVYCAVHVNRGPQAKFYRILDPIRKRFHVAASGELMLIKKEVLDRLLPVPPCTSEDSYLLFRALELGYEAHFCSETYVATNRTESMKEEQEYKARTTLGSDAVDKAVLRFTPIGRCAPGSDWEGRKSMGAWHRNRSEVSRDKTFLDEILIARRVILLRQEQLASIEMLLCGQKLFSHFEFVASAEAPQLFVFS